MADDTPPKNAAPEVKGPEWLLQFYSPSKSTEQTVPDPAQPLPDFPATPSEKYRVVPNPEISARAKETSFHISTLRRGQG
jgi:hypothetical protein